MAGFLYRDVDATAGTPEKKDSVAVVRLVNRCSKAYIRIINSLKSNELHCNIYSTVPLQGFLF